MPQITSFESLESRQMLSSVRLGSISGSVFHDLNADAKHEAGEAGVKNAVVFLDLNGNRVFDKKTDRSATTDKRGAFTFTSLAAGTYRMYEVGDTKTLVSAPGSGWFKVQLAAGQNVVRRQFGNASLSEPVSPVLTGRNVGYWTLPGVTRTSATSRDGSTTTTLGVLSGGQIDLNDNDSLLHNNTLAAADLVVKYTYYGGTDFNGRVDGADYARIDTSTGTTGITGWFNGDFDYNGKVDGADYSLIDTAFLGTGISLTRNPLSGIGSITYTPPTTTTMRTAKSAAAQDFALTQHDRSTLSAKNWLNGNKLGIRAGSVQTVIDDYHQFGIDFKSEYLRLAKNV